MPRCSRRSRYSLNYDISARTAEIPVPSRAPAILSVGHEWGSAIATRSIIIIPSSNGRGRVLSCAIFTVTGISYIDISLGSKIARLESFREREREQVEEFVRRLIPDQRFSFAVFANTS